MVDSSGGNIFFLVPFSKTLDLKHFFKVMEGDNNAFQGLIKKIKDWGLSHPTLEEVFLKLINSADELEEMLKRSRTFTRLSSLSQE